MQQCAAPRAGASPPVRKEPRWVGRVCVATINVLGGRVVYSLTFVASGGGRCNGVPNAAAISAQAAPLAC
eukprot:5572992-Lingulodinium_polyedra.AAC.1